MARYESYGEYDVQYVDDLDSVFQGVNNRARPDSLNPGMLQESNNFRLKREGVAQVRDSITVTKAPLTLDDDTAFTIPFYVYGLPDDDTSTSNTIPVTSMTFAGPTPLFTVDASHISFFQNDTIVSVGAIAGAVDYTPGNYRINSVSTVSNSFFVYLEGDFSGVAGGATTTVGAPQLQEDTVTAVYGSSLFEDPANEGEPYIIVAGNTKAVAVKLSDQSTVDITYDSGAVQIGSEANLIQAFNKVYIFRKGHTALRWNGDLTGSPNFTPVPSGSFTQPVLLDTNNNTVISNGVVTVSETGHNLENGDTIVITDKGSSGLTVGDEYRVNVSSADEFYFYAEVDDLTSHTVGYIARLSAGGGYIHMPGAEYGVFHQDRMVVPFTHNDASPPVSRDIVDEILFSQAEQPEVFDPLFGQSRLMQGGDDKVMGLFSFTEDKLLVFMRDSIYSFTNTTNIRGAVKTLLTQEIGLVARRSVVQVANQVIFLSDNGVYGLSFQDLYNLRGNDKPLSEPIQGTIDTINKQYWHKSVAVYFDNRYYIAVPTGDSQNPDTILIFNFLNGQWESVDTVAKNDITTGAPVNWDIQNLIVGGDGDDRGVYAINSLGGIHRLDSSSGSNTDQLITQIGGSTQSVPIEAKLRTRQFNFKDIQRKKWNNFELQLASNDDLISNVNITFTTENIDDVIDLEDLVYGPNFKVGHVQRGEDISIRGRIGNRRAYGCDCTIDVVTGKPKIKVIKVSGGLSFNSTQEVK